MKFFSEKNTFRNYTTLIFIFFLSLVSRIMAAPFFKPVYDEVAYSSTAFRIAESGQWFNIYGSDDLFFFPPFFNWLSALFILAGFERLLAVRTVTILISSGIAPLLYLLLKNSGLDSRKASIAALLWIIFPGVTHYSITGQVETPFLFFVLLSFFFFKKRNRDNIRNLILSALFLAIAVWTKETALGFIPVFSFMMIEKKETRNILKWGTVLGILTIPLLAQSFLPHNYDIFFELSNDNITWGSVSFIKPFINIGLLVGVTETIPRWAFILLNLLISTALILSAIFAIKYIYVEFVKFSLISIAVFIPFFIFFPKKFHYYLLPVLLFFLVCFSFTAFKKKTVIAVIVTIVSLLSLNGLSEIKHGLDNNYRSSAAVITRLGQENLKNTKTVVSPTPELMRYIAEQHELNVIFHPINFTARKKQNNCMNEKDRCILDHDYYITDEMFFEVIFCSTWPIKIENCDVEAMKYVIGNTELLLSSGGYKLYKIIK